MLECLSPKSSHPLPLSPKVRYTQLCLFSCLAYRFILGSYLLLSALGIHCCVLVFSSCDKQRLFPSYGVQASHCSDFICCGGQAQQLWHVGLVAQWHVGSSWIRYQTHAPCMAAAAAAAASLQSCQTLCYPIDSSPLGSSVSEILQTRILEWAAISFSNA